MTAQEYLWQYQDMPAEIHQRAALIRRMRKEIFNGPSTNITANLTPTIGKSSTQSYWSAEDLVKFKAQLQEQEEIVSQFRKFEHTIIDQINSIDDSKQRTLLLGRYINMKTWRELALDLNKTEDHVRQTLHAMALEAFTRKFSDKFYKVVRKSPTIPTP